MLSQISTDERFDLDMALTPPENSSPEEMSTHESTVAAAGQLVDEMSRTVFSGGDSGCAICMESFQIAGAAAKQVPCGHVFHSDCIARWLSLHNSCPLCRFHVSAATDELNG